jgi:hypothetical protein
LFTHLTAQYFNLPYIVDAIGGMGNEWIHRTVINGIEKYVARKKKILLIVGWSDPSRREIYFNDLGYPHTVSENACKPDWHKEYMTRHFNHEFQSEITTTLRKSVRGFCHAFDVDYIECFAFTDLPKIPFLDKDHVLEKNWAEICGDEGRLFNPNTHGYGHQNKLGQEKIAKALIGKIVKRYG